MKLAYKIVLINIGIAVIITAITLLTESGFKSGGDTAFAFGLVCLGLGVLNLIAGVIVLFTNKKNFGTGMLISSAVLLLLSGISCGSSLSGMKL